MCICSLTAETWDINEVVYMCTLLLTVLTEANCACAIIFQFKISKAEKCMLTLHTLIEQASHVYW
jgi:hypothetical protein